jgi:hypothetical protein
MSLENALYAFQAMLNRVLVPTFIRERCKLSTNESARIAQDHLSLLPARQMPQRKSEILPKMYII